MSDQLFFQAIKLAMKASKEYVGLEPSKEVDVMRKLGYELGKAAAKLIESSELNTLVKELSDIWSEHGYGKLEFTSTDPMVIEVWDCVDCLGKKYGVDIPLCSFKEGFLEAILSEKLNLSMRVREVECCGTLNDHCIFHVEFI
jgi:hypothetical protein